MKPEVSRQRKKQIELVQSGRCATCGKENSSNQGCEKCLTCMEKWRKKLGLKKPYKPNLRLRADSEFWKHLDLNRPTKEIAVEHNVRIETVLQWKHKMGIKLKRGRPSK